MRSQADDYKCNDQLKVGNGAGIHIANIGKKVIRNSTSSFQLNKVLHVPKFKISLLSIQKFNYDNNSYFKFHPSHFCIKDHAIKTILHQGPSKDGLYCSTPPISSPAAFIAEKTGSSIWHHRLGHPHSRSFHHIINHFNLSCSSLNVSKMCQGCALAKSSRLSLNVTIIIALLL